MIFEFLVNQMVLLYLMILMNLLAYILKAEKVAVMAILANKNWRKKCVNLDKAKIATKARKS